MFNLTQSSTLSIESAKGSTSPYAFLSMATDVLNYWMTGKNATVTAQVQSVVESMSSSVSENHSWVPEGASDLFVEQDASDSQRRKLTGASGLEFQVNTYTTSNQTYPSIASLVDGGWVDVWQSYQQAGAGLDFDIYMQRYTSIGAKSGSETKVNTYTTSSQDRARVAALVGGGWVVVWGSYLEDGSGYGVYGQQYSSAGASVGSEFRVNTYTTNDQKNPAVVGLVGGGYVIVWESVNQYSASSGADIYAQFYAANGTPAGSEFQVSTYTTNGQSNPSIGVLTGGGFVVVWFSYLQDGSSYGVYAQQYGANGAAFGSEFKVNTYTTNEQSWNAVAGLSNGGYVIAWNSVGQDGSGAGIYAQLYAANGTPVGSEFRVNTYTTDYQSLSSIATLTGGNFVITWHSYGEDGSGAGIYAQLYTVGGTPVGSEFLVNTYTTNIQAYSVVTATSDGGFVVTWHSLGQDGNGYGIYAQRFDSNGNKVGVFTSQPTSQPSRQPSVQPTSQPNGRPTSYPTVSWKGPSGLEFQVNTYTTNDQVLPFIATLSDGGWVDVWQSYQQAGAGLDFDIYMQRYTSIGAKSGAETLVNTYTTSTQASVMVAGLLGGGWVVVWHSLTQDGSNYGIYGQQYSSAGAALGSEFRVNSYTTDQQSYPAVSALTSGGYIVVWHSVYQDGSGAGIYGQRYSAVGAAVGSEFRVNTYTTNDQVYSSVAGLTGGGFVATWFSSLQDGSSSGVYGQQYSAAGAFVGSEFKVNTYTTGEQSWPVVAGLLNGGYVIAWQSADQDGSNYGIYAQLYAADGTTVGSEFRVNTYTTDNQSNPSIAALANGDFVVTWHSVGEDGSSHGVYAQLYSVGGSPLVATAVGAEFQVNTYTTNEQSWPIATATPDGGFVITWHSLGQDSNGYGIYAQRFDSNGNKVGVFTSQPTSQPSYQPSFQPSRQPSIQPSTQPSVQPTRIPSTQPTSQPSVSPSNQPSEQPSVQPSAQPSLEPSCQPSTQPTVIPSTQPSIQPSVQPTRIPSTQPTSQPSVSPSNQPSEQPSFQPTIQPSLEPSCQPSTQPTVIPSIQPSTQPSVQPTRIPSRQPTSQPSVLPSGQPSEQPSFQPTIQPSLEPSYQPSTQPTVIPSIQPSIQPSVQPTRIPSRQPTSQPSVSPSNQPSEQPSVQPSVQPSLEPSCHPSTEPTVIPSTQPSIQPSVQPTRIPSRQPTSQPSVSPSNQPSEQPSFQPTIQPSLEPSCQPSTQPTVIPSIQPSTQPSVQPTRIPSTQPTSQPSVSPSNQPSEQPSFQPTIQPSLEPSYQPSTQPTVMPSTQPSIQPSVQPTRIPSRQPTSQPSVSPSNQPSEKPSVQPSIQPSLEPSCQPSTEPTVMPSTQPSIQPSVQPTRIPSRQPTSQPSVSPSNQPSEQPSQQPSIFPSSIPSNAPSAQPSVEPTVLPSSNPSIQPSSSPSGEPTDQPSSSPSDQPTDQPSVSPSGEPSVCPTAQPSVVPTVQPNVVPTRQPSVVPSVQPIILPSSVPSIQPNVMPSLQPSVVPTKQPSVEPSLKPSFSPSSQPSVQPSVFPSLQPFTTPSVQPTMAPTMFFETISLQLNSKNLSGIRFAIVNQKMMVFLGSSLYLWDLYGNFLLQYPVPGEATDIDVNGDSVLFTSVDSAGYSYIGSFDTNINKLAWLSELTTTGMAFKTLSFVSSANKIMVFGNNLVSVIDPNTGLASYMRNYYFIDQYKKAYQVQDITDSASANGLSGAMMVGNATNSQGEESLFTSMLRISGSAVYFFGMSVLTFSDAKSQFTHGMVIEACPSSLSCTGNSVVTGNVRFNNANQAFVLYVQNSFSGNPGQFSGGICSFLETKIFDQVMSSYNEAFVVARTEKGGLSLIKRSNSTAYGSISQFMAVGIDFPQDDAIVDCKMAMQNNNGLRISCQINEKNSSTIQNFFLYQSTLKMAKSVLGYSWYRGNMSAAWYDCSAIATSLTGYSSTAVSLDSLKNINVTQWEAGHPVIFSLEPTKSPTFLPTSPTSFPSGIPTLQPSLSQKPSGQPVTAFPTMTLLPTTKAPSGTPTASNAPSVALTNIPSRKPSVRLTFFPTLRSTTLAPSTNPSFRPTGEPTEKGKSSTHFPTYAIAICVIGGVLICGVAEFWVHHEDYLAAWKNRRKKEKSSDLAEVNFDSIEVPEAIATVIENVPVVKVRKISDVRYSYVNNLYDDIADQKEGMFEHDSTRNNLLDEQYDDMSEDEESTFRIQL